MNDALQAPSAASNAGKTCPWGADHATLPLLAWRSRFTVPHLIHLFGTCAMTTGIRSLHCLLAATTALCAGTTLAGESLDVGVAGRIKPDTAVCRARVWTTMDYGTIAANTLKPDSNGISVLEPKRLAVSAYCTRPSKFSIRFVDAQEGTAVADEKFVRSISHDRPMGANLDKSYLFGLGQDSQSRNIGALLVQSSDEVVYSYIDGEGVARQGDGAWIESAGTGWTNIGKLAVLRPQKDYTVAPYGETHAVANLMSMALRGEVIPAIDMRPGHVDLTKEVNFSGRFTVEIRQL